MTEEAEVKECRNHRCPRRYVPIQRESPYCSSCGAKLKPAIHSGDIPPVIDVSPDLPNRGGPKNGTPERTNGGNGQLLLPGRKLEGHPTRDQWLALGGDYNSYDEYLESEGILPFMKFKGDYTEWKDYLEKNGVGLWTPEDMVLIAALKEKPPQKFRPRRDSGRVVSITSAKPADTFSCADADVEGCPLTTKAKIEMPNLMYQQWVALAKAFDTEWLAYLKGERRTDGVWEIKGMYFPPQTVTGAHVDVPTGFKIEDGTIGAVHSHVAMGVFFSGEDKKHMNHPIELIVNRKGEVAAAVATPLECGRNSRVEATITLMGTDDRHKEIIELLKTKLTKEDYRSSGFHYNRHNDTDSSPYSTGGRYFDRGYYDFSD